MDAFKDARKKWYDAEQTDSYADQDRWFDKSEEEFKETMDKVPDGTEFKLFMDERNAEIPSKDAPYYHLRKEGDRIKGKFVDPMSDWRSRDDLDYSVSDFLSVYVNEPDCNIFFKDWFDFKDV